ncbi:G-protein alpha subunit-domain-containing protein [Boletus reticuloceps]|uniref:G-protein alpha subunit-domain-containing protein n=1 Tax=Boletus reticuloceps TaxID=495285 RepID=A0A8I3A8J3_9AGAM|nr:G-protein alpha subunit-domain-containing protein [Boletus reticuloceps]
MLNSSAHLSIYQELYGPVPSPSMFPSTSGPFATLLRTNPVPWHMQRHPSQPKPMFIPTYMPFIHQNGFTDEELMTYRPTIYRNTLDSAQAIYLAMRKIGPKCIDPNNRVNTEHIFDYCIDLSPSFESLPEIAEAIHKLWQDPIIPKLMDHCSEFYLMDSAVYFFTDVLRIGAPNYLPTENDVLRARLKTTGITETRFTMGQLQIHMFDVSGQWSERKKWIHCFESVTSIIFCTALSEYDQVLLEEKNQNRMAKSLILFESIINS